MAGAINGDFADNPLAGQPFPLDWYIVGLGDFSDDGGGGDAIPEPFRWPVGRMDFAGKRQLYR